jgi:Zn-dependent M16 (insulinase) family peptidase
MKLFMYGLTDEQVQARRGMILEVNKAQLIDMAQKYILEPKAQNESSMVIFGSDSFDFKSLEEKGWRVENFSEGLKLRQKLYKEDPNESASEYYNTI